jgi:tRNA modification GTPase
MNGRLDLAQVESLSDTLAAETEQQRRAAIRGNSGALGRTYDSWREFLLQARGELEALIDFSEDQHFDESPTELLSSVTFQIKDILARIQAHETASQRSELLRNGIRIALLGPPNAGKSSLMNQIIGREASIVSTEAGTTRDIVEATLDIRGYLCSFADTAGFRGSTQSLIPPDQPIGAIESEGIRRAKQQALDSDIIVVLASVECGKDGEPTMHYDAETLQLAANADSCLVVINKTDSIDDITLGRLSAEYKTAILDKIPGLDKAEPIPISCREAQTTTVPPLSPPSATAAAAARDAGGIQNLIDSLVRSFLNLTALPANAQDLLGVTERQRQLLAKCRAHLDDFVAEAQADDGEGGSPVEADIVIAAEHLRYAATCLARITGRGEGGDVEEVLGVIFEK